MGTIPKATEYNRNRASERQELINEQSIHQAIANHDEQKASSAFTRADA